jgi:hypothetical protein
MTKLAGVSSVAFSASKINDRQLLRGANVLSSFFLVPLQCLGLRAAHSTWGLLSNIPMCSVRTFFFFNKAAKAYRNYFLMRFYTILRNSKNRKIAKKSIYSFSKIQTIWFP